MAESFTIMSAIDGTSLTFSRVNGEFFSVLLKGPDFEGQITASSFISGPPSLLFEQMGEEWRGWPGEKSWIALEEELKLTAASDATGHVCLRVTLQKFGTHADWKLQATLQLEAGSLERLAGSTRQLFSPSKI